MGGFGSFPLQKCTHLFYAYSLVIICYKAYHSFIERRYIVNTIKPGTITIPSDLKWRMQKIMYALSLKLGRKLSYKDFLTMAMERMEKERDLK